MNIHISSVQEGKKPYRCDICNAKFTSKQSLNGHMVSVHEGKKPFKCETSDATFARKNELNRHIAAVHESTSNVTFAMLNLQEKII